LDMKVIGRGIEQAVAGGSRWLTWFGETISGPWRGTFSSPRIRKPPVARKKKTRTSQRTKAYQAVRMGFMGGSIRAEGKVES
jgi:hypothetical protein